MTEFRAARLPRHRGPAAWADILGPGPVSTPLEADARADVVVVGAGFAGLAAARRLTQIDPGLSVMVLEAGRVAEGAAGRNSGFMIDIPHDLTSEDYSSGSGDAVIMALNRAAQDFAAEAVADYDIPAAFFEKAGKINGAATAAASAHNNSLARHLADLGEPYEMLDADQMAEITGSRYYRSGLFTPGTVMLQPAGFARGLAQGLRRDGVKVHDETPVLGVRQEGGAWSVETPKARVAVGRVLLASNGHLESFGVARGRLYHLFLFAAMTRSLTKEEGRSLGGASRWGVTPSDPMGTTVRRIDAPQGGDRIVVRTSAALRPGMEAKPQDLKRAEVIMRDKFEARFPDLSQVGFEHTWAGHLCLSRNGVSVTDEIAPGVFSACVQNGLGTARGTLTGIAAADRILGHQSEIFEYFRQEKEPLRVPPPLVQTTAGNGYLRLNTWRARAE